MVSLAQLVTEAGSALRPVGPLPLPSPQVRGVHVSELVDPTTFLDGGELVLTTGVPFTVRGERPGPYVDRLARIDAAGIVVGLGQGIDEISSGLREACRRSGVPLLVVPPEEPFQRVTRAYWALVAGTDRTAAVQSLSAQSRIVRAIAADEPAAQIVRIVAQSLGGWAAFLPHDDAAESTGWPASRSGLLPVVRTEARRLFAGTELAAATFAVSGHDVVAYPVAPAGALAVGAGRPLSAEDRLLVVTAQAALETALAGRRQEEPDAERGIDEVIADLVGAGHIEAARFVARRRRPRPPVDAEHVARWVDDLAAARGPLVDTVTEHLRGGRSWERTARSLDVHRNTVRSRIAQAEQIIGRPLSDPDVSASLWLALREL
ncbi:PucR family transcriptional regulator [Microbacterium sp.]|uniref:PucR family transcriptional regulator n=1 Tax=Microbacterium sp. TaxID=51671 RepID=UPI003F949BBF